MTLHVLSSQIHGERSGRACAAERLGGPRGPQAVLGPPTRGQKGEGGGRMEGSRFRSQLSLVFSEPRSRCVPSS